VTVIKNDAVYPCGTQESFPSIADSNGNLLSNSAHSYYECANKGICDRTTGTCGCFDGYSGSACQFAACPTNAQGSCSGHGTCQSAKTIAAGDTSNIYNLWDEHSTLGCVCDPGYSSADCSERTCKYGADPLYSDDEANPRVFNNTLIIYTQASAVTVFGTYAIVFTDNSGKAWQTAPLSINAECKDYVNGGGATVTGLITVLEGLPNNIIPAGSIRCLKSDSLLTNGTTTAEPFPKGNAASYANVYMAAKFTLVFTQTFGELPPLQLNFYLDGSRPTLYTSETTVPTLGYYSFSNGFSGEDTDYVPDLCEGVTATLTLTTTSSLYYYKLVVDPTQTGLLKTCLGNSNGNDAVNLEVYNWQYGSAQNPHLIKLIETTPDVPSFIDPKQCHYVPNLSPMNNICVGDVLLADGVTSTSQTTTTTTTTACNNFNPPGFYAVLEYDTASSEFRIYTRAGQDYNLLSTGATTEFYLFTTTGYLNRVNAFVDGYTNYGGPGSGTILYPAPSLITNVITSIKNNINNLYNGNVDCASNPALSNSATDCLKKGDLTMFFSTSMTQLSFNANPVYPQIYTVGKVSRTIPTSDSTTSDSLNQITLDKPINAVFTSYRTLAYSKVVGDTSASIYKFYPPAIPVTYTSMCSGRGICDKNSGVCQCFAGYTSDNCAVIDALAM
jgi:hypothetical protein